jgi:hypothetical protein
MIRHVAINNILLVKKLPVNLGMVDLADRNCHPSPFRCKASTQESRVKDQKDFCISVNYSALPNIKAAKGPR